MRRPSRLGLACLLGFLSVEHAAAAPGMQAGPLDKVFAAAAKASAQGDCAGVVQTLRPHLEDPALATYSAGTQSAVLNIILECEAATRNVDAAHHDALIGTHRDGAGDNLWKLRLGLEISAYRDEAAVVTLEAMSIGHRTALNATPTRWLMELDDQMERKHETALRRRLLSMLTASSYQPIETRSPVDGFRRSYAEMLFAAGDQAQAQEIARQVTNPDILLAFSVDLRFRALLPVDFDGRAAAERFVADRQAASVLHPDALDPLLEEAEWLVRLGRAQEALDLLQKAGLLAQNSQRFDDVRTKLNWWWDDVADASAALGHYDDTIAAYRQGGRAPELGLLNVSQRLNLAKAQLEFGHPRDTLVTLEGFSPAHQNVSGYGQMVFHFNHGCALAELGETAKLAADLAYVRAHAADSRTILRNMLLCTGDLDGAARAFIDDLGDPDHRAGALLQLSDYDAPPPGAPENPALRQLSAIEARADVRAAIASAGGARHFHLQR